MRYTVEVLTDVTYWYKEGTRTLHREDGPAVEYDDGSKYWYLNGKRHREDGPAIVWADGTKYWYVNGDHVTEQEFLERTAPVKELTIAEIEQLLGHQVKIIK